MAKDIAQRTLDQAGFRIANLGNPEVAGDATKTDNATVPKSPSGTGSPGTSFLAAPADHVHPASTSSGGGLAFLVDDLSMQAVSNERAIIFETAVDLVDFPGELLALRLTAIAQATGGPGQVKLVAGGDLGQDDGELVAVLDVTSPSFAVITLNGQIRKPTGHTVVKIIAVTGSEAATLRVRGKSLSIRGA